MASAEAGRPAVGGLRERKKRATRRQLPDTRRAPTCRTGADPGQRDAEILDHELVGLATDADQDRALARYRKFGDLIWSTPSLRAFQSDTVGRFVDIAAGRGRAR